MLPFFFFLSPGQISSSPSKSGGGGGGVQPLKRLSHEIDLAFDDMHGKF